MLFSVEDRSLDCGFGNVLVTRPREATTLREGRLGDAERLGMGAR
jgi:hypothetical protein